LGQTIGTHLGAVVDERRLCGQAQVISLGGGTDSFPDGPPDSPPDNSSVCDVVLEYYVKATGAFTSTYNVGIFAANSAGYTVTTNSPSWITLNSYPSSGSGVCNYTVAAVAEGDPPRSGTITICSEVLVVNQI
jgi:hypothetical protein